jgi:hypothetical protein
MTDPTTEPAVKEEDQHSFNWWVIMIPFILAMCVCIYMWVQDRSNMSWLFWAVGALVAGLVIGSIATGTTSGGDGGEAK